MRLVHIDRNPAPGQLVLFGLLWPVAFGLLGRLLWRTGAPWAAGGTWLVAALVPAAGALRPEVLRIAYVALSLATAPVGFAASFAAIAAVYYLVVTPLGLFLRLFGRDPVARRSEPDAATYWTERRQEDRAERYFRQF